MHDENSFFFCYKIAFFISFQDEIGLKEWLQSLRSTHKNSLDLLGSMAKKAGKIYGTERDKVSPATGQPPPPNGNN